MANAPNARFWQSLKGCLRQQAELLARSSSQSQKSILQTLGLGPLGWTQLMYCDSAFAAWHELLRERPDDFDSMHHLALMHHSRAFDLELSPAPRDANDDWEAALHFWSLLWRCDAFWEKLQRFLPRQSAARVTTELRSRWPETLLQLHVEIAFDSCTQLHRAQFHLRLARSANFPGEIKERVLRRAYDFQMEQVPQVVWRQDVRDPDVIRQGTDAIERFLEYDPVSLPAAIDALRLQSRLLDTWYARFVALPRSEQQERRTLCAQLLQMGEYWRKYFDPLRLRLDELDWDIRDRLAEWFRVLGDAAFNLAKCPLALDCYEVASQFAMSPQEQHRCQGDLLLVRVTIAEEKVTAEHVDALEFCEALRRQDGHTPESCYLLAAAFQGLLELDQAIELCLHGVQLIQQSSLSASADEHLWSDKLRCFLRELEREKEEIEPMVRQFSSLEGWRAVRSARIAIHQDRRDLAIRRLREACLRLPDAQGLKQELALVLNNAALDLYKEHSHSIDSQEEVQNRIREMMLEALRLDPQDRTLLENFGTLVRRFGEA